MVRWSSSTARQRVLHTWAALVYWTGKVAGVLVLAETAAADRQQFTATATSAVRWRLAATRAWNAVCLAAVAHRIVVETWPVTVQAVTLLPQASCYDTVCGGVWCVYACVYYAVAWLDRTSEICALVAAVTWRRRSTAECLNSAAAGHLDDDDGAGKPSSAVIGVPWHAYLIVAFPVAQFAMAANVISPGHHGPWRTAATAVAAVASCAPVAAHGTAAALLVVASSSMRSVNRSITRLLPVGRMRRVRSSAADDGRLNAAAAADDDENCRQRDVIARLARRHWRITGLVTGGVCGAYGVDLMAAVLLAAVRVTYVAISVFHRLTDDSDARTNMSLAVVVQLIAWFGQFTYLAYTCDELAAQSSEMFDNLNTLLLDIFKESRLSGEPYISKMQEIEAVQEFMRQVVARKVIVHACGGLITLNLSLITTVQ
ncbi:putative gustatory receptor 28b isoform X2 [Aphis craccivora]|uniref:Gustatory receptor n=1 Tax=Aphis craccivora TaxID=307492 RepID=A0A6G0Z0R7_APHCR|nr:putative gustatory receptor 28b isoform X2 [Aphis craccivora]